MKVLAELCSLPKALGGNQSLPIPARLPSAFLGLWPRGFSYHMTSFPKWYVLLTEFDSPLFYKLSKMATVI